MNPNFPWTKPWQLFSLKVLGYYRPENVRLRQGLHLYRSCKDAANNPTLRRHLPSLPVNTFHTEHQLILIHVWILHNRMLMESKPGKQLDWEIFNHMWLNTERRMRFSEPLLLEMSFSKYVTEVQKLSFGAMTSYDKGLSIDNDKDHDLASALFRNLWENKEDGVNEVEVYKLAKWMRAEVHRFKYDPKITFQALSRNEFKFSLPNGFKPNAEDAKESERLGITGPYKCELDISGKPYWWDVKTRESFWERPDAASVSK